MSDTSREVAKPFDARNYLDEWFDKNNNETDCEHLARGDCCASVDGYCIGGTTERKCHA